MRGARRSGGRVGRMALGLAALLLVAGCRDSSGGEVRAIVIGERTPRLLDPASGRMSEADRVLAENAAQGLVRFDAAGNIAPGLAERWAVSDDGLSYVFRLKKAEWSDGRRVRARDVVRLLERQMAAASRNPLKDTVGAVRQIVAMTDRVIAIELAGPRSHLLQLLAQPDFALVRDGRGTGPFVVESGEQGLLLTRAIPGFDGEAETREQVRLAARPVEAAVADFAAGKAELVLGGTSADLAVALGARLPRGRLRVDPVAGLFGLMPVRASGLAGDAEVRALLDQAIDRGALVAALGVPQLRARTSLLQPGLDGIAAPAEPLWAAVPLAERRAALVERAAALVADADGENGEAERPTVRVLLPPGPGGSIILRRLQADWGALGFAVEAATGPARADFRWVDAVAPSTSPAWFLRSFRCGVAPVCLESADQLLDAARLAGFAPQRSAFFAEAERQMRDAVLFIPVAAPVRWSLTGRGITGFSENRFARHPLTGLREAAATRNEGP